MASAPQPPPAARYRSLDGGEIVKTLVKLKDRIAERFPEANLKHVAGELEQLGRATVPRNAQIRKPNIPLRAGIWALILGLISLLVYEVLHLGARVEVGSLRGLVEFLEPTLGSLAFLTAFILFLWTLESRLKRNRALRALHELRSLAHIVDMHQLTKDPEHLTSDYIQTPSSPKPELTAAQLNRYLDYCTEMLALTSKVAALYVQGYEDPVVLNAVDDIENLTTGLSRKIWQKIVILDRLIQEDEGGDGERTAAG